MGISTIEQLCAVHDEDFVRSAYSLIFGREADSDGLHTYTSLIRKGTPKEDIIFALATSEEGKNHKSTLIDLKSFLLTHKRRSYRRFLSRVFRLILGDDEALNRRLNALQSEIYLSQKRAEDKLSLIESETHGLYELGQRILSRQDSHGYQSIEGGIGRSPSKRRLRTSGRIVFNLSTARHWRGPAVGIVRVERELASYLLSYSDVTYVYWNATSHCFSRLGSHSVDEILNERWLIPRNSSNQNIHEDHQFSLVETDLYISIGLDWDLAPLESTGKILIDSRCKCIFACYDLIPILFPEFSVEASLEQRFKHHLINIAQLTTSVFTISENTATDLHQFWNDADMLIPTPPTQKIELASLEQSDKLPHLSESDAVQIKHVLNGGNFVLYVSSIEARKNHRLLVNIWRELFSTRGNACPTLVFVGMPGWGTADLISQIRRSHAFAANKITVLTDTSDALLRYLYSYCLFSVFPSHYEGWGLAATEAMALGKVCVVANNSGLVEASQGLCPALHPLDYSGWKVEIEQLLDDELYRRELESNIRTNFRDRSWSQFSKDFCDKLVLEYSEPSFESDGSYNSGTLELEP